MSEALNEQKLLAELEKLWSPTPGGQRYKDYLELRDRLECGGIADLIASVVVALPCKTWPIVHPSIQRKILHHQMSGLNT